MNRQEFMSVLRERLKDIPEAEANKAVQYFEEYFDDALEAGKTEQQIVEEIGPIDKVVENIKAEFAFEKVKQQPNAKNTGKLVGVIVLALCSAPVTIPLAIALIAIVFALAVAFFAVVFSLGVTAIALIVSAVIMLFTTPVTGIAFIGMIFVLAGAGLLIGCLTYYAAKGCIYLIVKLCGGIYRMVTKKEVSAS